MNIFLAVVSSNAVNRHVEYDKLRFHPDIICNAACEDKVAKMYIFLQLGSSNAVKRHVEYDKLRFQPEINCNAVCEEFLKKYVFIFTPIFLKWCQATCY